MTTPLRQRSAWKALEAHYSQIKDAHLRQLFAQDPSRGERLTLDAEGIYFDYSKNRLNDETLRLLVQLANESGLREHIEPGLQCLAVDDDIEGPLPRLREIDFGELQLHVIASVGYGERIFERAGVPTLGLIKSRRSCVTYRSAC